MSKAQDRIAQQMLDAYNAAIRAAGQKSPEETFLSGMTLDTLNKAKNKDYSNILFNFADPAERKRQRDMVAGAGARGTAALGTPNATALALDKQNRDDEFAEDTGRNYQEQVSNAIGNATGMAGNLAQQDQSRRNSILGSAGGMAQQGLEYSLRAKTPWWKSLLNSAQQGATMAAMAA
jgi:hypothetical protein